MSSHLQRARPVSQHCNKKQQKSKKEIKKHQRKGVKCFRVDFYLREKIFDHVSHTYEQRFQHQIGAESYIVNIMIVKIPHEYFNCHPAHVFIFKAVRMNEERAICELELKKSFEFWFAELKLEFPSSIQLYWEPPGPGWGWVGPDQPQWDARHARASCVGTRWRTLHRAPCDSWRATCTIAPCLLRTNRWAHEAPLHSGARLLPLGHRRQRRRL